MRHVTDNDLTLHFYGELAEDPAASAHLAGCLECQNRLDVLHRTLDRVEMPVPARPANYEEQVWNRLRPKLPKPKTSLSSRYYWGLAAAACLAIAFFAGRQTTVPATPATAAAVRQRLLIVAVESHLERSRLVLAELVNASPDPDAAESLLEENRLYRQTAVAAGDRPVVSLLEDLERVLLEVAHTPESASPMQWQAIRERIEAQGLVFRIHVTETQLQGRVAKPATPTL